MNKAQFIEALATRLDTDRRAAASYLDAVFDTIYSTVSKGEEVVLTGFGKFEKRDRAARTARNPATGASVKVKKTSVPGFKAGTEFRAIVSGAKKVAKAPAKKAPAKASSAGSTRSTAKAAPAKATKGAAPAKATKATRATKASKATTSAGSAPAKKATRAAKATKTSATRKSAPAAKTARKTTTRAR